MVTYQLNNYFYLKMNATKSIVVIMLFILMECLMSCAGHSGQYICKPCNLDCDTISFSAPGICPHCNMQLIEGSQEIVDLPKLQFGSGNFLINDTRDTLKKIRVFYHQPKEFNQHSNILMVIPGSGRNADDYRDAWEDLSEQYNVLILSPEFSELYYSFENYHLAGIAESSDFMNHISPIANTNKVKLDENNLEFNIQFNSDKWIFGQLDRIFDLTVKALESDHETYDLFGHSAGGHLLQRLALFHYSNKAHRVLASNASFYTLPNQEFAFPFGLDNIPAGSCNLQYAFKNELVIFLGERDNTEETRGTFLISESADQQGFHRLERGQFFYNTSVKTAIEKGLEMNWQIEVIPDIGHDHVLMSKAAGDYLYADN